MPGLYLRLIEIIELKAKAFVESSQIRAQQLEGQSLLKYLNKYENNSIFLLSEAGKLYNSQQFAKLVTALPNQLLVLVIGGALGFSSELKNKYKLISLSPLTFPHQLTRVILLEQIYRSIMIIKKKKYHY